MGKDLFDEIMERPLDQPSKGEMRKITEDAMKRFLDKGGKIKQVRTSDRWKTKKVHK